MQARGRNGWFDVKNVSIENIKYFNADEGFIQIQLTSKNIIQTRMAPVIIELSHHEAISFCSKILGKCNSFESEILKAASGINKGE